MHDQQGNSNLILLKCKIQNNKIIKIWKPINAKVIYLYFIQGQPDIVPDIVKKYCWIMSTFTLPRYYEGVPGQDVMYHGVGKLRRLSGFDQGFKKLPMN